MASNRIDLCAIPDVCDLLNLRTPVDVVATTSADSITAGLDQVVIPGSMQGIGVGNILMVGSSTTIEYVLVNQVDEAAGTFTSTFNLSHAAPVPIANQTNVMLSRFITSCSVTIMRKIGRLGKFGDVPARSTLCEPVNFDEWYDGNGNSRMLLRNSPVRSVTTLTVNGMEILSSSDPKVPGYVVDDNGRGISIRSSYVGMGMPLRGYGLIANNIRYCFARGTQNVHVIYSAGFDTVPWDLQDACIELVALQYRRRNWIDQQTVTQAENMGTIRYRDGELPAKVQATIEDWRRRYA